MKKRNIIILAILIIILVISFGGNMYFIFKPIPKIISEDICEDKEEVNERVIICSKTNMEEYGIVSYLTKIRTLPNGAINTFQYGSRSKYYDVADYNVAKMKTDPNYILTYNDESLTVTLTYGESRTLNSDGKETSVWYVDYQRQLEDIGYVCEEQQQTDMSENL